MPQIEDVHSALRGCTVFNVLHIKQAYHQIPIAEESQPYLIINTYIGLFAFKRLRNGIHSGPAIFHRIMASLLSDIPKAVGRLDDILVAKPRGSPSHPLSCAGTSSFCRFQNEQDKMKIPSAISSLPRSQA